MARGTLIDASLFNGDQATLESRLQISHQLLQGLLDDGYVRVVNHGIPSKVIRSWFSWNRRFFDLPETVKNDIKHIPGPNPQRGYSSLGSEKTSRVYAKLIGREVSDKQRDAREHFDYGAADDDEFRNVFPPEPALPGFKAAMESLYNSCAAASFDILAALELALEVPPGTFVQPCKQANNASEGRINHYPPIPLDDVRLGDTARVSPHFDLGVITLLFTDGVAGLEFEDRHVPGHEAFLPIETDSPDEMIVSVAETLQRWTADRLPASLHRVTLPASQLNDADGFCPERYSIVYLCKADRNADVGVLPEFRVNGVAPKYDSMTALQYHQQRIAAAY